MTVPVAISLHRGSGWISKAIQLQTRSSYSHAGVVLPDGKFIEAREGQGVRALPYLIANKGEKVDLFTVTCTEDQAKKICEFLWSQVSKPYDWLMVLRFVTRRKESRSTTGKWFCSELVFAAFQSAGVNLLRDTQPWEVSPGLLARSPLLQLKKSDVIL